MGMRIRWLGHSAFQVNSGGLEILIDPFISGNPKCPVSVEELNPDLILVTHAHEDHLGDAFEIAKAKGSKIISIHEIAVKAEEKGVKAEGMNIGGSIKEGELEIIMVRADHSSEFGSPVGFVLMDEETSLYHAGDTGIFSDMKLISELYKVEVALLPIGSRYTMGIREATKAAELISPKVIIPMHYGTFPVIEADPNEFKKRVESSVPGTKVVVLNPGEEYKHP